MTNARTMSKAEVDLLAELALDAACLEIQKAVGQSDGGPAGIFFSGEIGDTIKRLFGEYIRFELGENVCQILDEEIRFLGMELISTGGGCEAWHLQSGDYYVWLTMDDGSTARNLKRTDALWLGFYEVGQDHSDETALKEGPWEVIKDLIVGFKEGKPIGELLGRDEPLAAG